MALKNYTTSISVEKTLSEIQGKLAYVGAKRIMTEYDDTGNVVALSFQLELNGQQLAFSLPTDWRPVATAWRITKDWVDAQVAIIETKMVTTTQVFLPYTVTSSGKSLYHRFLEDGHLMIGSGNVN